MRADWNAVAVTVTADLGLEPRLTALQVQAVADPCADSFLPPLRAYPEDQWASIESRILQAAEEFSDA